MSSSLRFWIAGGAVAGSLLGAFWDPGPGRLVACVVAGIAGGLLGAAAAAVMAQRWPLPLRLLATTALLGTGFLALALLLAGALLAERLAAPRPG